MQDDIRRRREGRDQLVDTMRRYGMGLLAALVLLPLQIVIVGAACVAVVYICVRQARQRGRADVPTG